MSGSELIVTAHQPAYLPWLGLLHKVALADIFVSFDDVQYQDKDWNNRNRIKTADGPRWLTVPVYNKDHYRLKLKNVLVRNDVPWRRKHWKSMSLSYAKAPYAKRYLPFFEDVYRRDWHRLSELNEHILKFFLAEMDIRVEFLRLSDMGVHSTKSQRVLDMCKRLHADVYIFGEKGKDYANESEFRKAGINIEFQEYRHPEYAQLHGPFVARLSALDLLFNHGPASYDIMMSDSMLKEELIRKHCEYRVA